MRIVDDRTPEQMATHPIVVGGTDRFMSGWGAAANGTSVAGWACSYCDADRVWNWIVRRGDMSRVRYLPARPKAEHVHIYVVDENHPALR